MMALYRAAGIGKGRAGPALARPAPAGRRSYPNRHAICLGCGAAASPTQLATGHSQPFDRLRANGPRSGAAAFGPRSGISLKCPSTRWATSHAAAPQGHLAAAQQGRWGQPAPATSYPASPTTAPPWRRLCCAVHPQCAGWLCPRSRDHPAAAPAGSGWVPGGSARRTGAVRGTG